MKILILCLFFLNLHSSVLSDYQYYNLKKAYNVAKLVKCQDGMTFENAIAGIMLQESSAGKELIGDKYKNGKLKPIYESSLGMMQIKLSTAKEIISKSKYLNSNFKHLLKNDKRLVNMLLTSSEFSALLASYYLKTYYEIAKKKGFSNPYFRAISRYNGGWNNSRYYNKVKKRIKWLEQNKVSFK